MISHTGHGRVYLKETVFEGYYAACWECSFFQSDPEFAGEGYVHDQKRKWLREYLHSYLKKEPKLKPFIVDLDDLLPKEVFKSLLKNPNKKFRFKVTVEVEELPCAKEKVEPHGI